MYRSNGRRTQGFTLIEILVTIAIIGILTSIGFYGYNYDLMNSRDQQRLSNMNSIANALDQYYTDHNAYPAVSLASQGSTIFNASFQLDGSIQSSNTGCSSIYNQSGKSFLVPDYISSIPQDPTNELNLLSGCKENTQGGQYLYTAVSSSSTSTPQSFELMAKMEKLGNMSDSPPDAGNFYYKNYLNAEGLDFCTSSDSGSACTQNYYLGPKIGG